MTDRILIEALELRARLGVPAQERELPQRLTAHLGLEPRIVFDGLDDLIDRTVDYAAVCELVKRVAAEARFQLLESLAAEIVREVKENFPVVTVELELRKYILPDTSYVAVRLTR